jgi:4-amino-4-deoxy-L-arabinose transferase-like glycosyltransferase
MNLINQLKPNSTKFIAIIALFLFVLTIVVRLPFFFRDVINWDEGTYILIGKSFLDGYSPERDYWSFRGYPYALFILIFGKSIIAIRFAGALCVAIVSFFLYLIGKTLSNQRTGILAGTFFILLSSLWTSGQATMSEHIALVPLIGAFLLLVKNKDTPLILFWAGVLMTMATIVRLNLGYVTLIIGVYVVLDTSAKSIPNLTKNSVIYASGCCLVILLSLLPYIVAGDIKVWWTSNISFALSYSSSQNSIVDAFITHLKDIFGTFKNKFLSGISILVWLGGLAGFMIGFWQWKNFSEEKRHALLLLTIFLFSTSLSIVKGGAAYSHYLIQLVPFFSLYSAIFLDVLLSSRAKWLTITAIFLVLLISFKPIIGNYKWRILKFIEYGEINYGASYEIAKYLKQHGNLDNDLYIMNKYHIVYLLTDSMPMTKTTVHPSTIGKEYLLESFVGQKTNRKQELAKILAKKPKFIIKDKSLWYLRSKAKAKAKSLLENTLENEYELVKTIKKTLIYRRI